MISNHWSGSWSLCHHFNWPWLGDGLKYGFLSQHLLASFLFAMLKFHFLGIFTCEEQFSKLFNGETECCYVECPFCLIPLNTKCLLYGSLDTFNLTATKLYAMSRYKTDNVPIWSPDSPFSAWHNPIFKLWYLIIMLSNSLYVATDLKVGVLMWLFSIPHLWNTIW